MGWLSGGVNFVTGLFKGGNALRNTAIVGGLATGAVVAGPAVMGALRPTLEAGMTEAGEAGAISRTKGGFAGFYEMIRQLGGFLEMLGLKGGIIDGMKTFGMTPEQRTAHAEQQEAELAAFSPLDERRVSQRVYDEADPTRFTVSGQNGSPPSVQYSTEEANFLNSTSLGVKAVKDGLGKAVGGIAGGVAGLADWANLDRVFNFVGGHGFTESEGKWGEQVYSGVAGTINGATDAVLYGSVQAVTGINWEPTIRSEFDAGMYDAVSTASAIAITAYAGGIGAAHAGIGGSSVVAGVTNSGRVGNVLGSIGNSFRTAASGLQGTGSVAWQAANSAWGQAATALTPSSRSVNPAVNPRAQGPIYNPHHIP